MQCVYYEFEMSNFNNYTISNFSSKVIILISSFMFLCSVNHARQRSGEHMKQPQQYPNNSNFGHLRSGSTPNQMHGGHYSPRMQHRQFQQQQQQRKKCTCTM